VRRYQKFVKEPKQFFSPLKSEQDLRLFGEAPEVLAASCQLHGPGLSMPDAGGSVNVNYGLARRGFCH
jgi:hypothetical protein